MENISNIDIKSTHYINKDYSYGISIPLTCYNESVDMINKCLNSIYMQDFKYIELIIINDGPDNNWVERTILSHINIPPNIIRFVYIRNPKNMGVVYSKNMGLDLCTQKYIMQFDADFEIISPQYISTCINTLESNPLSFGTIQEMIYRHDPSTGRTMVSRCSDLQYIPNICKTCGPPIHVMFKRSNLNNMRYRDCVQFDADFWIRFWYANSKYEFILNTDSIPKNPNIYTDWGVISPGVIDNRKYDDPNSPYGATVTKQNIEDFNKMGLNYSELGGVFHEYIRTLPGNDVIYNHFLNC